MAIGRFFRLVHILVQIITNHTQLKKGDFKRFQEISSSVYFQLAAIRQANVLGGLTQGQNLAKNGAGITIHQLQTHQSPAARGNRPWEFHQFSAVFWRTSVSSFFWTMEVSMFQTVQHGPAGSNLVQEK